MDSSSNIKEPEMLRLCEVLEVLQNQSPDEIKALHDVLTEWTMVMAKDVLDEIRDRLKLIAELRAKTQVIGVDEVHELLPLFRKGLWMFGAQFESIEFTANEGMTRVIRRLFGDKNGMASRSRPDFVVLPDSSVGFYGCSTYDPDFNADGTDHVVIVEIKTTGIAVGSKEKEQIWRYVKELRTLGHLQRYTRVDAFILGSQIEFSEDSERIEAHHQVRIRAMLYDTLLTRAKMRLFNLHERVMDAPFLVKYEEQLHRTHVNGAR